MSIPREASTGSSGSEELREQSLSALLTAKQACDNEALLAAMRQVQEAPDGVFNSWEQVILGLSGSLEALAEYQTVDNRISAAIEQPFFGVDYNNRHVAGIIKGGLEGYLFASRVGELFFQLRPRSYIKYALPETTPITVRRLELLTPNGSVQCRINNTLPVALFGYNEIQSWDGYNDHQDELSKLFELI